MKRILYWTVLAASLTVGAWVLTTPTPAACAGCASWSCNSDSDCGGYCRCWFGRVPGVGHCG